LILATNNRPPLGDRSQGLWRRLLLVPFRVFIPEEKQDRELARKLRGELPGIVNWALEGLVRLRQQGHFTESKVGLEALKDYRLESNPARMFLADYCSARPGGRIRVNEVYDFYKLFCRIEGFTALNGKAFGKEVRRQFPQVKRSRPVIDGQRVYAYEGLSCSYLSGGLTAESDQNLPDAA
jgi:putative DNA primase/helicase